MRGARRNQTCTLSLYCGTNEVRGVRRGVPPAAAQDEGCCVQSAQVRHEPGEGRHGAGTSLERAASPEPGEPCTG